MLDSTVITSEVQKPKPIKKTNVPVADIDFGNLGAAVSTKWSASPWLTLQWTTSANFSSITTRYMASLDTRIKKGSSRPQVTKGLKILEKKMDEALPNIKSYLYEKYQKSAKNYYPAFGIIHKGTIFILPKDQDGRSKALELLVDAIDENGFGDKQYGSKFWKAIQTEYDQLLADAAATDSTISSNVGDKNVLKKEVKKVLNSIIAVIRGNYPDTYKTELRNWGFQKEKY
jgi:hypothetical protein